MIKNGLKSIRIMIRYSPVQTILIFVLMLAVSTFAAFTVHINKNLVDSVGMFVTNRSKLIWVCIWGMLLFLSIMFESFRSCLKTQIDITTNRNLIKYFVPVFMRKLNKIEYSAFEDSKTHDLINRMSSNPQTVVIRCFNNLINLATSVFSIVGIVLYFMNISIAFTVVYIVITLIYCYCNMLIAKIYLDYNDKKAECKRKAVYYNDLLTQKDSLAELHVFNGKGYVFQNWKRHIKSMLRDLFKITIKEHTINLICNIVLCVWIGFMLLYATKLVVNGEQTVGFFVAVMTSVGTLSGITSNLTWAYKDFVSSSMSYDYFDEFMNLPEREQPQKAVMPQTMKIRFEDVCFTYPGTDIEILKGVSFTLEEGERISIVGENGAGKSTIIKLLCGLYTPDKGKIYVGDCELEQLPDEVRKELFSVVFQDFGHYSMTLRENVAFGNIEAIENDEAIKEALSQAMADELLEKSEKKLDTNLGKLELDGIDLSGGQWQRLSIARAFFSKARYVILDEPTAALDPLAECRMYESFESVLRKRGAITISHRLASAKLSDRILVLSEGRIFEDGNHDALMKRNGLYARMFEAQASWYEGVEGSDKQ